MKTSLNKVCCVLSFTFIFIAANAQNLKFFMGERGLEDAPKGFYYHSSTTKFVDTTEHRTVHFKDSTSDDELQVSYQNENLVSLNFLGYESGLFERYDLNVMGMVVLYSYSDGIQVVSRRFYPSGKLKEYNIYVRDTSVIYGVLAYADGSSICHFYENGILEKNWIYSDSPKQNLSYFDNGIVKTRGDYLFKYSVYVGKYEEFNNRGLLLASGSYNYRLDGIQTVQFKTGKWKYYEDGKKTRTEFYDSEGNLLKTKGIKSSS